MKQKFSIAMSLAVILAMLLTSIALADDVYNKLDGDIDATLESISLTAGGNNGTVGLYIQPRNNDGDNGCNFQGTTEFLVLSVTSSNTAVATVTPDKVTFGSCGDIPSITVTPLAVGSTMVSVSVFSNNTGGTFNLDPAKFTVNVAAPTPTDSTPPVISRVITGTQGNNDWYVTDVIVDWTVNDPDSTVTILEGCIDTTINYDTLGVTLTCKAKSAGGTSIDTLTIKRDATAPVNVAGAPSRTVDSGTWYNHAVDLVFTGTDAKSGIASCSTVNYSGPDGLGVTVDGFCTDVAGNKSDPVPSSAFNFDGTAPTNVVLSVSDGNLGSNNWYTSNVTVHTSSDSDISGVSCTPDKNQETETAGIVFNGSCTNGAGLIANAAPITIKLDKTGPIATLSAFGTLGSNGWYTSDVTVTTSGDDSISGPVTCRAEQYQTGETAGQAFNGYCTNDAGLTTHAAPLTVKLDKTGPTAVLSAAGTLGQNGWYISDVTVSTSGTESISSPVSCTGNLFLTADSAGTEFNGSCTNDAGLTTNAAALTVKRDATAPTASASASPAPNANGWNNTNVTVSFNGTDGLSGITSCSTAVVLSKEEAGQSASGTCTDNAGNVSASATASGINIDKTAPVFGACPAAEPFILNTGLQSVGPITVNGDISGLYSSTLSGSVDTSSIGPKVVNFSALDNAGNSASTSCSYNVIYAWSGFFQPIDMNMLNTVKAGSAVPVKFSLGGNQGLNIFAVNYPRFVKTNCISGVEDAIETTVTAGSSTLTYDALAGQYIYVWKTDKSWVGSCGQLQVKLIDGTIHFANFKFK